MDDTTPVKTFLGDEQASTACGYCGYDLAQVPIGGQCPNCSTPVMPQFQGGQLPTSGRAVTSLVLGIVSIPTCMCYGVPALVCGILAVIFARLAKRDIQAGHVAQASRGMATAGFVCGWVGIGLALAFGAFIVAVIVLENT